MLSNKISVAGLSLAFRLATAMKPEVNVYFGQYGTDTLASYCDAGGFDYVTLAFLSASPEADPATNYPTTDFGTHCGASVYMINNTASRLLSGCTGLAADIQHCQKQGKRVLLSTGGVWSPDPAHNYAVTTEANGEYFADFLWNAFGAYNSSWTGPRPFDRDSGDYTVLDGFDFDIEVDVLGQKGYIAMLKRLRQLIDSYNDAVGYQKVIITGAPQCPLVDGWADMKDIISTTAFDRLWIQFYNNDLCEAGTSRFNYVEWVNFIANGASQNARLYVGLPASMDTTGYISVDEANALVDSLRNQSTFGGVMVWDASIAKDNAIGGVPLYQAIQNHMNQATATPTPSTTGSATLAPSSSVTISFSGNLSLSIISSIASTGNPLPTNSVPIPTNSVPLPTNSVPLSTHTVATTDTCTFITQSSTSSTISSTSAEATFSEPFGSSEPSTTLTLPSHTFSPVASAPRARAWTYTPFLAVAVAIFMIMYG